MQNVETAAPGAGRRAGTRIVLNWRRRSDRTRAAGRRLARPRRHPPPAGQEPPQVDDGAGDPLGDRGFPAQFFDYYRLAAHNAGDVTRAVIAGLGRLARDRSARRTCRLLAARRWRSAAKRIAARSNG